MYDKHTCGTSEICSINTTIDFPLNDNSSTALSLTRNEAFQQSQNLKLCLLPVQEETI